MMRVLIAEDDAVSRHLLELALRRWGYDPVLAPDGSAALLAVESEPDLRLVLLDVMMPGTDGLEVCRGLRARPRGPHYYVIMLTARAAKDDVIEGLRAGADDYLAKPFDPEELRARLNVGARVVGLQRSLAERVAELEAANLRLEEALGRVRQLQDLIPICSYCRRVRDDQNYWQQVEGYITAQTGASFSHGVCPDCYQNVSEQLAAHRRRRTEAG
jgi:phosphoserine phosphatase RsbU/P